MPHEWNNLIVVTKEELVPNWFEWNTLKSIVYRSKKRGYGLTQVRLGGNGRVALYDFDTLELHIQHALGDPRNVAHVFEKHYRTDKEAVSFYRQHQLPDGSYLAADHQDRYIVNASVLKTIIAFRADIEKERKRKGLNLLGITEVLRAHTIDFQKTLKAKHKAEHTLPESLKRFKQVLNDFEKKGYASLISGKHGNDNSRKVTVDTVALLTSLFVSDATKPSPTDIHRRYVDFLSGKISVANNETGELYDPQYFKALSDSTVSKYLTSWDVAVGTSLIRQNRQKQMGQYKPYAGLDRPVYAGSLLTADDRNPAFLMPNGNRVWLYIAFDVASEAVVAIVHGQSKQGIILELYRQIVRNIAELGLNMPDGLECESNLNSEYKETLLMEGVMFQNVRIEANNARGKIAENFNGRTRYQYEKTHENYQPRPFAKKESNQAGTHEPQRMHYDDIVKLCYHNYVDWNNAPHYKVNELSKWEYFIQRQHPDLKPINYNAILPYLGYETKTSCNVGVIRLRSGEYWLGENGEIALGEKLINLMRKVEGRNVTVYWLDDNAGKTLKALVFIGNLLVCEAIVKPTFPRAVIERGPEHERAFEIVQSYIKTIENYGRRSKNAIEKVSIIDNTPARKQIFTIPGQHKPTATLNGWQTTTELPPLDNDTDFDHAPTGQTLKKSLKDRLNSN